MPREVTDESALPPEEQQERQLAREQEGAREALRARPDTDLVTIGDLRSAGII